MGAMTRLTCPNKTRLTASKKNGGLTARFAPWYLTTCSLDHSIQVLTSPPPAIPIRDLEDKKDAFPGLASESSNSPSYALFEKTLSNLTAIRDAKTVVTIVADEAGPVQSKQSYRKSYAQLLRGTSSTRLLIGVGRGAGWRPL